VANVTVDQRVGQLPLMPVARSDRNAAGEISDPRIIGELRAVGAELAKRSSAAHESDADR
jgi:hypothetical protein